MILHKKNFIFTRYFIAGIVNTIFGYFFGLITYYLLVNTYGVIVIGIIANIVSISFTFFNYKLFVFKTRGNWLKEYFKSFLVYGLSAIINIILLWLFVELFGIAFWISQFIAIALCFIFTYFSNKNFTFKIK